MNQKLWELRKEKEKFDLESFADEPTHSEVMLAYWEISHLEEHRIKKTC